MPLQFYPLKVAFVRYDTNAAVQIGFRIPEKEKEIFQFDPGQYLTISLMIDGQKVRRAYSICSSTDESIISILVKRVEKGLVSNFLNNKVKVGDRFDVLPPNGHFKLVLNEQERHHYYFFGAGSGITPLLSMIGSVLEKEPTSHCHLLYGNRDEDNIIFRKKLERMELVYNDRFRMRQILSRPKKVKKGFLQSEKIEWQGRVGRVNQDSIDQFLKDSDKSEKQIDAYFICGPGAMIEATYESLRALGIEKDLIHREYFSAPISNDEEEVAQQREQIAAKVTVILDGKTINLNMDDRRDIVQVLLDEGEEPPYSCLSGTCSTCMAKLEKGEVSMDISIGLEDDEKEKGFILTCQSHPLTEEVVVNFDKHES